MLVGCNVGKLSHWNDLKLKTRIPQSFNFFSLNLLPMPGLEGDPYLPWILFFSHNPEELQIHTTNKKHLKKYHVQID